MAGVALAGSVISGIGSIAGGMAQRRAANYEAAQLEVKAEEERAASAQEAGQIRREKNDILSRNVALSAASGFSATDETSLDLAGDIAQEGSYRELMTIYGGAERGRGLTAQAAGARMSGRAAMIGGLFNAAGTIAGGVSNYRGAMGMPTMFSRYGQGGPMDLRPTAYRYG